METKKGLEPVFPVNEIDYDINGVINSDKNGISKRFYAACAAMQGILANFQTMQNIVNFAPLREETHRHLIEESYRIADELLNQEEL